MFDRAFHPRLLIASLLLASTSLTGPRTARALESDLALTRILRHPEKGLLLSFRDEQGFTIIEDQDGRLLLLTVYAHLLEGPAEKLYRAQEKWSLLRTLELKDFGRYRDLVKLGARLAIAKHPNTEASRELQKILKRKWMTSNSLNPSLQEFANETIGVWLKSEMKNATASVYSERAIASEMTVASTTTVPVFSPSARYPVSAYWASRSLTLPPDRVSKERGHLTIELSALADAREKRLGEL